MAQNLWAGAVRKGLAADRPTVPDFPSETFGLYYETDTGLLYFGPAGGTWQPFTAPADQTQGTAGTGVAVSEAAPLAVQRVTLTLTNALITVLDADDFGSLAIWTFPDRNLHVLNAEVNLSIVKDGVGFISTTDLDIALGTAAASNTTLATTMLNVLPKQDANADALTVTVAASTFTAVGTAAGLAVPDAANNILYLNASAPTEISEDGTLTVTGTIDLYFIDLGNRTS